MHFTNDEGWVKANGKKDSTENRLHTVIILSNKTTTNTDKNPFFFENFVRFFQYIWRDVERAILIIAGNFGVKKFTRESINSFNINACYIESMIRITAPSNIEIQFSVRCVEKKSFCFSQNRFRRNTIQYIIREVCCNNKQNAHCVPFTILK